MRYHLVNFEEDDVLDVHLNLIGMNCTPEHRNTLRQMGKELRLLLGKNSLRHLELQAYIKRAANLSRLLD